jgi:predicted phage terminase large subunit-like protein
MIKDRKIRTKITKESHLYFFHLYFAHYVKYQTAPFQLEMLQMSEDESIGNFFVVAFRGSGKSTILTTSYPIWSILGKQQKKFVLLLCQTQNQAKQHMMNLRRELENNPILKSDLGPFREESDEWGSFSLVFSNHGARITAASTEQSIRGLRHNQHRPDLIIGDDLEDLASTKTRDGRNKTYQWLTSEVIPAGDRGTRLVVVGNLLHEDSLLMRIKEATEAKTIKGVFRQYPLIEGDTILWPGKYPSMKEIEEEKLKAGNNIAWQREFMLHIVPTEEQAIHREWIQHYDTLPKNQEKHEENVIYAAFAAIRIGVDLAISKKDTADYTAMVAAYIVDNDEGPSVYILPKIINQKMTFPETVQLCKALDGSYKKEYGSHPRFLVESVGYQESLVQQLKMEGLGDIVGVKPGTMDKRSRLALTAHWIQSGKILFPREGAEELIDQIVNFGVEKHDDLVDAFSNLIANAIADPHRRIVMFWL